MKTSTKGCLIIVGIFAFIVFISMSATACSNASKTVKQAKPTQSKVETPKKVEAPVVKPAETKVETKPVEQPAAEVKQEVAPVAQPAPEPAPEPAPTPSKNTSSGSVKMSSTGICHAPGTQYYDKTKNFTPYDSIEACLNAGGRLPK